MVLLSFRLFLSILFKIMYAVEDSALYRNPAGDFSFAHVKRNPFRYLWVQKIAWSMVEDQLDCSFLCVSEPKCYSFNMAVYPDSKGLYLCEFLATDKYRETKKFHTNATFHHYSPWVSDKRRYISDFTLFSVRLTSFTPNSTIHLYYPWVKQFLYLRTCSVY